MNSEFVKNTSEIGEIMMAPIKDVNRIYFLVLKDASRTYILIAYHHHPSILAPCI